MTDHEQAQTENLMAQTALLKAETEAQLLTNERARRDMELEKNIDKTSPKDAANVDSV